MMYGTSLQDGSNRTMRGQAHGDYKLCRQLFVGVGLQ